MAAVYILYSAETDRFYIGSCREFPDRFEQHITKYFPGAFTYRATDADVYMLIENLAYSTSRKIEQHIKKIKAGQIMKT